MSWSVFIVDRPTWRSDFQEPCRRAERERVRAETFGRSAEEARTFGALIETIHTALVAAAAKGRVRVVAMKELPWDVLLNALTPWDNSIQHTIDVELNSTLGRSVAVVFPGIGVERVAQDAAGKTGCAPPAEPWRAPSAATGAREALLSRWMEQLEAACRGGGTPVVPSGIHNEALTEGLRLFAARANTADPVHVRVAYRDGSEARPFPLRIGVLAAELPTGLPELRLASMSLRHPEMDVDVDGCLFRNVELSVARPAAETDDVAFELARTRLAHIARHGPRIVRLYQTGFEPAIVGTMRAVAERLAEGDRELWIQPMHYTGRQYRPGLPWGIA